MTPEQFRECFGVVAEAGGGIAKLRQLVLQLGLSGRLGTRSASDEPVQELLARVTNGLVAKTHDCTCPDESPSAQQELPQGWLMVRMGDIVDQRLGKMLDKHKNKGHLRPYLRNFNVQWFRFDLSDLAEMRIEDSENEEFQVIAGDLLVCEGGEPGRAAVWTGEKTGIFFQKAIHRLRPRGDISSDFLALRLRLDTWTGALEAFFTGATIKHLTGRSLAAYSFALPPVPEQHRIVAKVDQLMAMLDNLEQRQEKKRTAAIHVSKASLDNLVNAEDSKQLSQAWERVNEILDVIVPSEEGIPRLRDAILGLALLGRLTEQRPEDTPIDALLSVVDSRRRAVWEHMELTRLTARGRKPANSKWREKYPEPTDVPDDVQLLVPATWRRVPWSRVGLCQNGRSFPSEEYSDSGIPLLRPGNLHASGVVRWTADNTRFLPSEIAAQCADYVLHPGDLVMNLTAQSLKDAFLGRVCILGDEWGSYLLNQRIARLTPTGINARFCLWLFKSPLFRRFADSLNQGTLIQHMYTTQVDAFVFGLPPVEEQVRIVATVEHLWRLLDDLEARRLDHEKAIKAIVGAFP